MSQDQLPAERIIRPQKGLIGIDFGELWRYRELFLFLTWRDLLVRYKQTVIGIAWAVLQPLLTMVVFTLIFGRVAGMEAEVAAPYAVMTFVALLPWQFFSNAITMSSNSLIMSQNMITKVYFPRIIIPTSSVLSGVIDFLVAFLILIGMIVWYVAKGEMSVDPVRLLGIPLFFGLCIIAAMGVGLWMSALNVKYRDVKYVVPFFVRMGLFVSPVGFSSNTIYGSDKIPSILKTLYGLNPMVGVIDGFRWSIIGGDEFTPHWPIFWISTAMIILLFISGAVYFRSTERTFADTI